MVVSEGLSVKAKDHGWGFEDIISPNKVYTYLRVYVVIHTIPSPWWRAVL